MRCELVVIPCVVMAPAVMSMAASAIQALVQVLAANAAFDDGSTGIIRDRVGRENMTLEQQIGATIQHLFLAMMVPMPRRESASTGTGIGSTRRCTHPGATGS